MCVCVCVCVCIYQHDAREIINQRGTLTIIRFLCITNMQNVRGQGFDSVLFFHHLFFCLFILKDYDM